MTAICHRANLSIYMVQALFQPTKESNKKPELDFLHTRHYSTFIHSTPPMKSIAQPPFAGDAVSVEVPSNTRLIPGSDGYLVNIALLPCYNSTPKDIMDNSFAIDRYVILSSCKQSRCCSSPFPFFHLALQ